MLFAYRLAAYLGNPYPEEMLAGMSGQTFRRWVEYDQVEPIGERRADLRMAILASVLSNLLGKRRTKLDDFMPRFRKPKRATDVSSMERVMRQWAASVNEHFNGNH